ncbi:MAG: hypothetical protein GX813_01605 [Erysipelotrichia bacterium]|nr:hypothetical protein [Erysipelotrichia bacterium]
MKYTLLTEQEMGNHYVGEAITLTSVMALVAVAVMAIVIYRIFRSNKGSITAPGGWKFSWN